MTNIPATPDSSYQDRVSLSALQQLLTTKGEGDEWDFKVTLGSDQDSRVELAKDALALCNLAAGGTLVIGVTDDYQPRGLEPGEHIDTTVIRQQLRAGTDAVPEVRHLAVADDEPCTARHRAGEVPKEGRDAAPPFGHSRPSLPGRLDRSRSPLVVAARRQVDLSEQACGLRAYPALDPSRA